MKKLTSSQVAIIVLLLMVLSLLAIFTFKLKLSPDFNASQVVSLQIDHETDSSEINSNISGIIKPVRIDKESTGKFHVYYQNVTTDNIASVIADFKTKQTGVLSADIYDFKPWGELYIKERASLIAGLGILSFLAYAAISMRKSGLTRLELLELLTTDLLSIIFPIIVLLGMGSFLGAYGLTMSISYWDLFLLGVAVLMIMKIYRISRMRDILTVNKHTSLLSSYQLMYKKYWPELTFILAFAFLTVTLPWLVLQSNIIWAAVLPALATLLAGFNFFFVDANFMKFLEEWQLINPKTISRLNLNKKW